MSLEIDQMQGRKELEKAESEKMKRSKRQVIAGNEGTGSANLTWETTSWKRGGACLKAFWLGRGKKGDRGCESPFPCCTFPVPLQVPLSDRALVPQACTSYHFSMTRTYHLPSILKTPTFICIQYSLRSTDVFGIKNDVHDRSYLAASRLQN